MAGNLANVDVGACCACKHQRKGCNDDCPLAKYFPPSKIEDFKNVHRLYGVNNVIKLLNSVAISEKDKTMQNLILEAQMRKDYPVHGSLAVRKQLEAQLNAYQNELDVVQNHLNFLAEVDMLQNQRQQLQEQLDNSSLELLSPTEEEEAEPSGTQSVPSMADFGDGSVPPPSDN